MHKNQSFLLRAHFPEKLTFASLMQAPDTQPFWHIIANPAARAGGATAVAQIEQLLQELGFAYTVQFTERRDRRRRIWS